MKTIQFVLQFNWYASLKQIKLTEMFVSDRETLDRDACLLGVDYML